MASTSAAPAGPETAPRDPCPLCADARPAALPGPDARRYKRCPTCGLAFVARADLPDAATAAAHYRNHDNRPDDPRYRAFLGRLIEPLKADLRPGMTVLDFGSGDGSPVRSMLAACGLEVVEYDPLFRPELAALDRRFDVILASEVVEHFQEPHVDLVRLDRLLKPGGRLGIMTALLDDGIDFAAWWYARDPTHVAFYAPRTMRWIGARFGWRCRRVRRTVILFDKD